MKTLFFALHLILEQGAISSHILQKGAIAQKRLKTPGLSTESNKTILDSNGKVIVMIFE